MQLLEIFEMMCIENSFVCTEVDFQKFFDHEIMYCDRLLDLDLDRFSLNVQL